jgi:membrane-associated HD superfamily phosphohydrolase
MLADAVEAASKTLSEPTPSRIKGLVSRIINSIFTDGQLEDCELTLKDLRHIEESFDRILTGIFHQRVEYPNSGEEQNSSKKEGNEGTFRGRAK